MLNDVRLAIRFLRRRGGMTATVVAALAIGIGASASVFSLADAILWHPLPFRDADRLVALWSIDPEGKMTRPAVQPAQLTAWPARDQVFDVVHAYMMGNLTIAGGSGDTQGVTGIFVSERLLADLEVAPQMGRVFAADDFQPSAMPVVVLSDMVWRARFGGKADALGQTLTIDNRRHVIVGVMPATFSFPVAGVKLWVPLRSDVTVGHFVNAVGRVRRGVSLRAAEAAVEATTRTLVDAGGKKLAQLRVRPFLRVAPHTVMLLAVIAAAAALILVIAVANSSNVLLAEAVRRETETATRIALGASIGRLARQRLAEALVIAMAATAVGVAITATAIRAIQPALPRILTFQTLRPIEVDWRALAFAIAVAVMAASVASIVPILRGRTDIAVRTGGLTATAQSRVRSMFVIAQLAVTLMLLAGAGLLLRGFVRLQHAEVGYDPANLLSVGIRMTDHEFPAAIDRAGFVDRVRREVAALPGIQGATIAEALPPYLAFVTGAIETEDGRIVGDTTSVVTEDHVDGAFFATVGIPLLRGGTAEERSPFRERRRRRSTTRTSRYGSRRR